jgi:hypothetical protein
MIHTTIHMFTYFFYHLTAIVSMDECLIEVIDFFYDCIISLIGFDTKTILIDRD